MGRCVHPSTGGYFRFYPHRSEGGNVTPRHKEEISRKVGIQIEALKHTDSKNDSLYL
jgi:hypothetical protein